MARRPRISSWTGPFLTIALPLLPMTRLRRTNPRHFRRAAKFNLPPRPGPHSLPHPAARALLPIY